MSYGIRAYPRSPQPRSFEPLIHETLHPPKHITHQHSTGSIVSLTLPDARSANLTMDYSQHYPTAYIGFAHAFYAGLHGGDLDDPAFDQASYAGLHGGDLGDPAFDPSFYAGLYGGDFGAFDAVQDFTEFPQSLGTSLFTGTLDQEIKAAYKIPWPVSPPEIRQKIPMLQPVPLRRRLSHIFHSPSPHWQSIYADKPSDARPKRPLPSLRTFSPPPRLSQHPLSKPQQTPATTSFPATQRPNSIAKRPPPLYLFCRITTPHTHPWPDSGDFFVESCERICQLCERFNGVSPLFGEVRTLRAHVSRSHLRNGKMRYWTMPKMMQNSDLASKIRVPAVFSSTPKPSPGPTAPTEGSDSALGVPNLPSREMPIRPTSPDPLDLFGMDLIRYYNPGATISDENSEDLFCGLSMLDTSSPPSTVSIIPENGHASTNAATPSNSTADSENASPRLAAYYPDPVFSSQTLLTLALLFQQILPCQTPVSTAEEWSRQLRENCSIFAGPMLDAWLKDIAPELCQVTVEPVG
ncbi:unnamed protein product [Zymoseptoria tritici ST99CH_1E4]|uniref:Uncharacterized protein n=1 Tax=Zymoseptoria tritici ST99CH_1E4 TaxID=1276532 RepID=A0A2H1GCN7_ZYMTR|nr:unnamed protein product [Zymoseptoria tritici ST99CH_1E4]